MKTIQQNLVSLIICLMLGFIVGAFVKTVKFNKMKVFTEFAKTINSLEAVVSNDNFEFISDVKSNTTKSENRLSMNSFYTADIHAGATMPRIVTRTSVKEQISLVPGIVNTS